MIGLRDPCKPDAFQDPDNRKKRNMVKINIQHTLQILDYEVLMKIIFQVSLTLRLISSDLIGEYLVYECNSPQFFYHVL